MRFVNFAFRIACLGLLAAPALAHEVRPAYLELRQIDAETYDALWKVPGLGENLRLGLYVELPAGCTNVGEPRATMVNNAYTERWSVKCGGGLSGGTIHIAGLSATATDVLVRLERLDGSSQVTRLTPSVASFVVESAPHALEVARTYSLLGIEHILTGVDHLLFVLALILITRGGWLLVKTVSAFTLSHSLTLTAATLGFVHVPPAPVEAVIALSIVFVAAEIVNVRGTRVEGRGVRTGGGSRVEGRGIWEGRGTRVEGRGVASRNIEESRDEGRVAEATSDPRPATLVPLPPTLDPRPSSLTARAPWIVAFAFGLIHGLGFAGGLSNAGLPDAHIPTALLFFSLGVEAGHFLFIGVVLASIALLRRARIPFPLWTELVPPYAIGTVAMFWLIQRIAAF